MQAAVLDSLITYNPWTLTFGATLADVARVLDETSIGHWPVLNEAGEYAGILTAGDVGAGLLADPTGSLPIDGYVKRTVPAVGIDACPQAALRQLLEQGCQVLAIVDMGRVVATLSCSDFLRELASAGTRLGRELLLEYVVRLVESVDSDATLEQAHDAFRAGAGHLVVVQGDFPLGAVTPASLAYARVQQFARMQRGAASAKRTLGQLLQAAPTIPPGRTLGEAASLMLEHQLDALAVVSQSGQLSGVLTEDRILTAMLA